MQDLACQGLEFNARCANKADDIRAKVCAALLPSLPEHLSEIEKQIASSVAFMYRLESNSSDAILRQQAIRRQERIELRFPSSSLLIHKHNIPWTKRCWMSRGNIHHTEGFMRRPCHMTTIFITWSPTKSESDCALLCSFPQLPFLAQCSLTYSEML